MLGISDCCTWHAASSPAADTLAAATTSLCPAEYAEVAAAGIGGVVPGEVAAVGITGAAVTTSLCPPPFHEVD